MLYFQGQNEDANVNAAVLEEAKQFGDILVGNFEDSYKNLVFKSLWLIEWAVNRFGNFFIPFFCYLLSLGLVLEYLQYFSSRSEVIAVYLLSSIRKLLKVNKKKSQVRFRYNGKV